MFLLDVIIRLETGAPLFDSSGFLSVYPGLGDNEVARLKALEYGGKPGSAHAYSDPAAPYIYLSPGTCEAAKHLRVPFDSDLEIYLRNASGPQFERLVTSAAYLAFVFADQAATNMMIKVPFPLLNPDLTAPLAEEPMAYFPCKSYCASYGSCRPGIPLNCLPRS